MKYEDLKIVQKWREYAGPKDERLEAESAKIYKIGFVLLSFGMLMIFFYQLYLDRLRGFTATQVKCRMALQRRSRQPCICGSFS